MRKIVMIILILACTTLVMALQRSNNSGTDQEAIEKAVLKANAEMTQAANSLDAARFFSYILDSDKGSIIQDGTFFKTRAEALEVVKAGFQGIDKMDRRYDQIHVSVLAPGTALLTAAGSYSATLSNGRALSGPFAVSLVFVLREGQWKVLHGHYSMPNRQ